MDSTFLNPEAADWRPDHLKLDLYENVNDTQPIQVDVMEFFAAQTKSMSNVLEVCLCLICVYMYMRIYVYAYICIL